jgi:UBX domain-containing protein 1
LRCSECSGQEILDPREFMKRAREEMGAQGIDEYRANNPQGGTSSFAGQGQSLDGQSVGNPLAPPPQEHTITFWQNGFSVDDGARLAAV